MSAEEITTRFTRLLSRFSLAEIQHALPLLVATFLQRDPSAEIPAPVRGVVVDWMAARRLGVDASLEELAVALVETYRERPVHPELRLGVEELFGELLREQGEAGQARADQMLGQRRASFQPRGAPAPGAVRASPLAAFNLEEPN